MPVKFAQNRMVQTTRNFKLFDQKKKKKKKKKKQDFYNHFKLRVNTILEDVSVAEIIF